MEKKRIVEVELTESQWNEYNDSVLQAAIEKIEITDEDIRNYARGCIEDALKADHVKFKKIS
jgi:hypothetical protein